MYRIDNNTAVSALPTPAVVGPNPNYYYTKGNSSTGVPATVFDADAANAIQEELCYVIEQSGATLSKTDRTQLLTAIKYFNQNSTANYAASTTAANTYTATLTPAIASYVTGCVYYIKFTNANTGAATLNLNSIGAKNIKRIDGSALNAGDIAAGMIAILSYDGTNLQLLNAGTSPSVIQNNQYSYVADTGAANAYVMTLSPAPTAYTAGLTIYMKAANANTGAATINVNSLGVKNIKLANGSDPHANAILTGGLYRLSYDGTNFQISNPSYMATTSAVQNGSYNYAVDGGSANAYTMTLSPAITAYAAGQMFLMKVSNTNTGASTVNVSGLGVKSIKTLSGAALIGNELISGEVVPLIYDGTNFKICSAIVKTNVQLITATGAGTYTPSAGTYAAIFELQAGGGGSGGTTGAGGQSAQSGPGGGGGYLKIYATIANIGASCAVSVGAAGTAGSSGNNAGGAGGNTTITINGSTWTAGGGAAGGGQASNAAAQSCGTAGAGGTNTTGSNATLMANIPGQSGGYGFSNGTSVIVYTSASGGDSQLGRGGVINGAGTNYGGGASSYQNASGANQAGLAGAQGCILVTEFTLI